MTTALRGRIWLLVLENAPFLLFVVLLTTFACLSYDPKSHTPFHNPFLTRQNLVNVLVQSSSLGVVAVGMTFVLLVAGIDLSVGSIMFLAAVIAGKVVLGGYGLPVAIGAILLVAIACGALNAVLIGGVGMLAFIVTLAMQYIQRGVGLKITQTRAMNLPESVVQLGSWSVWGVPLPVLIFAAVLVVGHIVLTRTPFGRYIYAVGHDAQAATKAGISVPLVVGGVYVISGLCAGIGGAITVAQLGAVSPTLGNQREFAAIAAAVLGGTSLFGGRGKLIPGTLLGAVLVQLVENGLVIIKTNEYLYPLITSGIIFVAVLMDSARHAQLARLKRRRIRMEARV